MRLLLCTLTAMLAACSSPESTRTRGGGPGGDIGNRPETHVRMHEGSRPYHHARRLVPGGMQALEPAGHARETATR